jgi:hypothetical protein
VSAPYAWGDDGSYRGEHCVDDGTAEGCYPYNITITNADPVVDAGPDLDGGLIDLAVEFTDGGRDDTHGATIDWGDGTVDVLGDPVTDPVAFTDGAGFFDGSHEYAAPGDYTITVTVTDDDGGIGTDTVAVTITDPNETPDALVLTPEEAQPVDTDVTIGTGFTDDGGTHELEVDLGTGDGFIDVVAVQDLGVYGEAPVTTAYAEPGTYTVRVKACDERDQCDIATGQLQIGQRDPDSDPEPDSEPDSQPDQEPEPAPDPRPDPATCQERFVDVGSDHPFCPEIEWLADRGIADGWPDGTFRPTNELTRQAVVAFLHRLAGAPHVPADGAPFSDVDADHPFGVAISWAAEEGIVEGFPDGTFRSTRPMTRQALAAMLHRLAGAPAGPFPDPGFADVGADHRFATEIWWAAHEDIVDGYGDGTFHPGSDVTRQAAAAFLHRFER